MTDVTQLLRVEAGEKPSPDEEADAQEVRNYVTATEHGIKRIREGFPVSIRLFREMHERLPDKCGIPSIEDIEEGSARFGQALAELGVLDTEVAGDP